MAGPKDPNGTTLRDGRWYSIITRLPFRSHYCAKWLADQQQFVWQGSSEEHLVDLDDVDEILHEVDVPADECWRAG